VADQHLPCAAVPTGTTARPLALPEPDFWGSRAYTGRRCPSLHHKSVSLGTVRARGPAACDATRRLSRRAASQRGVAPRGIAAGNPALVAKLERLIPLGRLGRPEDVAAMVAFLCTKRAGNVTG
jgi:hypothetical protein